jgi:ABC-type nickel/cobalt efflux system permease component RcnA
MMPRFLIVLLAGLLALLAGAALAQQADTARRSPLATQSTAQARPAAESGPLARLWLFVVEGQREMSQAMTTAIRQIKSGDTVRASVALAVISFLYGILHAVGPGHGKFVISSYALANERTVRRGILLSFMAAMIQAVSAIVLVGVLAVVLKATSLQMRSVEAWLETLSWGLIALLGGWLLWRQVQPHRASAPADHGHGHHHHPVHHAHDKGHDSHGRGHDSAHAHSPGEACAQCGHVHAATPDQLEGAWSWGRAWSLALAIGIRPCTGAIVVLLFALGAGILWAGIFATFAMAVGTAITVSALAAFAVGSRELATRYSGPDSPWALRIQRLAGIGGSAAVLAMGVLFCLASLQGPGPL